MPRRRKSSGSSGSISIPFEHDSTDPRKSPNRRCTTAIARWAIIRLGSSLTTSRSMSRASFNLPCRSSSSASTSFFSPSVGSRCDSLSDSSKPNIRSRGSGAAPPPPRTSGSRFGSRSRSMPRSRSRSMSRSRSRENGRASRPGAAPLRSAGSPGTVVSGKGTGSLAAGLGAGRGCCAGATAGGREGAFPVPNGLSSSANGSSGCSRAATAGGPTKAARATARAIPCAQRAVVVECMTFTQRASSTGTIPGEPKR